MLYSKLVNVLPRGLGNVLVELRDSGSIDLPTWDHRFLLVVDVALMLHRRSQAEREVGQGARYGFADSSPQAGHDWLITKSRFIRSSALGEVFTLTTALIRDAELEFHQHDNEDSDEPELPQDRLNRASLYSQLRSLVQVTTYPPVALGLGHTSLEHKVV